MKKQGTVVLLLFFALILGCSKNSTDDSPTVVNKKANLLATGDSARDLLTNTSFDKLLIEIGYVKGFKPNATSMTDFVTFLKKRTFKENIELTYTELDSPNEEELSLNEIADLESKNRTVYNDGKTLAVYIYFADAPSEDDDEDENLVTLGAVYRNTSMIIYEKTIRDLASKSFFITNADIETATLNHEFGHLFGLVDIGTATVNDHEDPEAENHCNVSGCLMRAELQFGGAQNKKASQQAKNNDESVLQAPCTLSGKSVLKILEQLGAKGTAKAAVGLGPECILDLQNVGGK